MITMEVSVSGSQIGRELKDNPEELAYALAELAEGTPKDLFEQVKENLYSEADRGFVIEFLKGLTAKQEEEE